jgi:serine/threonine-protein kinase
MGIVYKAEDTKLDRTVALKVLPPHALISEDDRARFYREARAAAALNHPNIAHVYEIDEAMAEGETRPFIAMEYIDGESLADRVAKGPLLLKDTISIATQIAEGLKAAHRKDVVHRDVKSGNVMITKDGVVKVLDFGLAKTAASTKLTQMGSTLGTVAYMSPEQARGEEVDRRSDIWSLGVILYEMITGRLPFRGDYEQAVVYGILNEDPESLTTLRAGVPLALDGIVAKLLAKAPDLRYQNVDELPADLKRIDLDSTATHSRLSTTTRTAPVAGLAVPSVAPGSRFPWAILTVSVLAALGLGFGAAWLARPQPPSETRRYTLSMEPVQPGPWPSISADGGVIAFGSSSPDQVFVKTLSDLRPRPVPYTDVSIAEPVVSPHGKWIAFQDREDMFWKRVPVDGSSRPINIVESPGIAGGADWKTEDIIAVSIPEGIVECDLSSGMTTRLTRADSGSFHILPSYVGKGGAAVFTEMLRENLDSTSVKVVNLETGHITVPEPRARQGRYIGSGHLLFTEARLTEPASEWTLMAASFDEEELVLSGPAVPVLDGATLSAVAISDDGTVVQVTGSVFGATTVAPRRLVFVGLDQTETAFLEPLDRYGSLRFSLDGRRVAVRVGSGTMSVGSGSYQQGESDVWVYDVETGVGTQLTFGHWNGYPVWLPDGEHVAYWSDRDTSRARIWVQRADGSESAVPLFRTKRDLRPWSVHPDGVILAKEDEKARIVLVSPSEGTEEVYLDSEGQEDYPMFSPDGRWVAFTSTEPGQSEVFVSAWPPTESRWRISTDGGWWPVWAPNGESIYYWGRGGRIMVARVETEATFRRVGLPEVLLEREGSGSWDIHPDGRRFLIAAQGATDSERSSEVFVIENWFEELKQIAPIGG